MTKTQPFETVKQLLPDSSVFEILPYRYDSGTFSGFYRGQVLDQVQKFEERINFLAANSSILPQETLFRLLTLTLSLSYYKATRAATINIMFPVTEAEIDFFRVLLENGLGEYAYINNAEWKLTPKINAPILTSVGSPVQQPPSTLTTRQPLVAVGGGKDSIVTIEALKNSGYNPLLYSVNARGAIQKSVAAAELDHITITRTLDENLLKLNQQGAPNGHIPVTAINSLIGLITAELTGTGPVIFSNEASADYGNLTWRNREINHQWSKSLGYEDLLRQTLVAGGLDKDMFFSLLRGYNELEITRDFTHHPNYFNAFTSCNRAYQMARDGQPATWCGQCPKCAFVFLLLAPNMNRRDLVHIFGKDMLDTPADITHMLEILGLGEHKPFECVGEPAEAVTALHQAGQQPQWADASLIPELISLLPAIESPAVINHKLGADRVPKAYQHARDLIGRAQ